MQPLTGSRAALRLMRPQDHDSGMATPRVRATVKTAAAPSRALDLCGCPRNALWVVLVNTHTSKSQEFGRNSVAFSLAMSVCATPVLQP